MSASASPVVGNWYRDSTYQVFEVVAIDEEENTVEIQYVGGEIDEYDIESWNSLGAENVPAPEDWSGAYDEMERDDLGFTDMNFRPESAGFSVEDLD